MIQLEVRETDPDTIETTWVKWLEYPEESGPARALARRDHLLGKGRLARVTVAGTVVMTKPVCPFCGESHPVPFDGGCLL